MVAIQPQAGLTCPDLFLTYRAKVASIPCSDPRVTPPWVARHDSPMVETRVAMLEGSDFEIDEQVTAQDAVVEHQVEIIVFVTNRNTLLAGLETKRRRVLAGRE